VAAKYFKKIFLVLFILILQLKKAKIVSPISFSPTMGCKGYAEFHQRRSLQSHNTENSKQIFLEMELPNLSPNFLIHVSVRNLNIPTIGLPILLQENMWTYPGNT
jgi:hypothetical protein